MRALIAMSGGVDSSVAALLTKKMGYDCLGCTMKLYEGETENAGSKTCCSLSDVEDARSVAYRLGMPYYVFNFKDDFYNKVIRKFIGCYEKGITPNPCIDCNRYMKFQKLFDRAELLECEKIVTGHYARVEEKDGKYILKKALDLSKDQSYVLYSLTQEQLSKLILPLGELEKTQVRDIAEKNGFLNAHKPDSQDICFVPNGDYAKVICDYTGKTYSQGDFKSVDGKFLGTHKGIIHYTLGQRKGLGISSEKPLYVCGISTEKNEVILGSNDDLFSCEAVVENFNWISGEISTEPIRCCAKVRYRQKEQSATAYPIDDGKVKIVFDAPQRAITAGQSAVIYIGDTVIGGGEIMKTE